MGYRTAICRALRFGAGVGLVVAGLPVGAQGIAALAVSCHTCHGGQGAIPPITGMEEGAFITLMQAFRDQPAEATIMPRFVTGLSDEEIAALAAYFAGQGQ